MHNNHIHPLTTSFLLSLTPQSLALLWRGQGYLCLGLALMSVVLCAGCEPTAPRTPPTPPAVEPPAPAPEASTDVTEQPHAVADTDTAHDAETLYNPYEALTETGQAPPDDYHADPLLWIPGMPYRTRTGRTHRGEVTNSTHVFPDSDQRSARYRERRRREYEKLQELVKAATNEQQRKNYVQAHEEKSRQLFVAEYTRGLSPLHAAKYLMAYGDNESARPFARQALDENPDDFHTLYVWSRAQFDDTDWEASLKRVETGYRRLLEMQPNSAHVLFDLGTLRGAVPASERIRLLEKSIQVAPDAVTQGHLSHLAKAYHDNGNTPQAIAHLKRHLAVANLNPYSARNIRKILASLERGEGWVVFID